MQNWNSSFNIPFTTKAFKLILGGGSEVNSCKIRSRSYFVWILQVCAIVSTQPEVLMMLNEKQYENIKDTYDINFTVV